MIRSGGMSQELDQLAARELGYGHDVERATGQGRQDSPLPRRVGGRVPLGMAQRRGVVDDDHVARVRERREVGRAQQRWRSGGAQRAGRTAPSRGRRGGRGAGGASAPRSGRDAAPAAARRARAPSARPRRARVARRRGRRWRCGDRAAGVRVGVDGRSLVGGGARGVAHYTAALLEALAAEYPEDEYRVLLPRGRRTRPSARHADPPSAAGPDPLRCRGGLRAAAP